MASSVIELNDSEIRVAREGEIILRTPGYAVLQPDAIILGENAERSAHLNPRQTHSRYWSNLNQDALSVHSSQARHNADLAWRQLLAIHEQADRPDEVIFTVPGSYSREQLSLLLGIVQSCPFTAVGLVDSAVAGAAAVAGPGRYVHIDMHLHYTVITRLDIGDAVTRTGVHIIEDCGITDIHDTCAGLIADLFIQQSRFDPQRQAETEQSLYDQIPHYLRTLLENEEVQLEIRHGNTRHQARLFREPLLRALQSQYEKIINAVPAEYTCLLSDRLCNLPGFIQSLGNVHPLRAETVFHGCRMNEAVIRSSGPALQFVTSLPATRTPAVQTEPRATPAAPRREDSDKAATATHVLINHRAHALGASPLYVAAGEGVVRASDPHRHCSISLSDRGASVRQEGELAVYVNGHRIDGQAPVSAGDTLGFAGSDTVYRFIHVVTR
jgi:hypothetical protein